MVGLLSQQESYVCVSNSMYQSQQDLETTATTTDNFHLDLTKIDLDDDEYYNNNNNNNNNNNEEKKIRKVKKTKKKNQVLLEGYVEALDEEDELKRTKSLTDDDLDELKGCLDLGFGFSYEEIPELCNTLPALELCYSMSQKYLDDKQHHKDPETSPSPDTTTASETMSSPVANWKISSPGDHPEDVKARLKFWAQAVACTVKLCS